MLVRVSRPVDVEQSDIFVGEAQKIRVHTHHLLSGQLRDAIQIGGPSQMFFRQFVHF